MARIRYQPDRKGLNELMRGPEVQAFVRQLAERGADIARGIAPVGDPRRDPHPGEYKAAIRVETLSDGGPHADRAEGRIVADSDHAADVEWRDGYHVLARAVDLIGE